MSDPERFFDFFQGDDTGDCSECGRTKQELRERDELITRLREQLDALVKEAESYVGIGHAFADEDKPLRDAIARARAALGVVGEADDEPECPACEDGYICRHGDGCLLDEIAAREADGE